MQDKFFFLLEVADAIHFPRIYVVVVGRSALARKGVSLNHVQRLFDCPAFTARTSPGPLSSGEGLLYALRDPSAEMDKDGNLVDLGAGDKQLFVADGEFAAVLEALKRKGNTLSVILRNLWDRGDVSPLTKRDRIRVTGAHLGVVTHITLEELSRLFPKVEAYSGFANRFLWILARRQQIIPNPPATPESILKDTRQKLDQSLTKLAASPSKEFRFTSAAQKLFDEIYHELEQERTGILGAVTSRASAQVRRLAMIYASSEGTLEVDVPHLRAALAVWRYAERSAEIIFGGPRNADDKASKLLRALKEGPLTVSQIHHQVFKRNLKAEELSKLLSELARSGVIEITEEEGRKPGRRAKIVKLLTPEGAV